MKALRNSIFILALTVGFTSCVRSQNHHSTRLVGGPCEGCEAVFEYGNKNLNSVDTLPGFNESETKLKISGVIYKQDGKTPAKGVILYIYHTNQNGIYPKKENLSGWARRHGYIRSWMKTDEKGGYTFYTIRPGVYPSRTDPAHIHITLLEPDGKYYYIADYLFENDSLLSENDVQASSPRGGSGILKLHQEGNIWVGRRDITLGLHIPGY
jgi:protocatechuate 3,4-dioxygenase, beta subunit